MSVKALSQSLSQVPGGKFNSAATKKFVETLQTAIGSVVSDNGTSTSGTPTTKVSEITTPDTFQLTNWQIAASQSKTANTQMKVIVTYSDLTTIEDTSNANTATIMTANAGGIIRSEAGEWKATTPGSNKPVFTIRVETAGTGTGTRSASMSALEVSLP